MFCDSLKAFSVPIEHRTSGSPTFLWIIQNSLLRRVFYYSPQCYYGQMNCIRTFPVVQLGAHWAAEHVTTGAVPKPLLLLVLHKNGGYFPACLRLGVQIILQDQKSIYWDAPKKCIRPNLISFIYLRYDQMWSNNYSNLRLRHYNNGNRRRCSGIYILNSKQL